MFMRKSILAAAALIVASSVTSASAQTVEFVAGQLGGGWYTMVSGMASILENDNEGLSVRVVPGGGTANPSKIQAGQSQLGMGLDIFAKMARDGTNLYEGREHDKLMMIGQSFSDNYLHFIRADNAPLGFEEVFKEKQVNIGVTKAGSSDEMTFRFVMDYYGTSYDDMRANGAKIVQGDYNELSSAFKDGQVDYVFIVLGAPGAAVIDMSQGRAGELVAWPEELRQDFAERYGYSLNEFPADTYPAYQDGPVPTIVMATTLMVSADVPDDVVYNITKSLCENSGQLPDIHASMSVFDCQTAASTRPVPVHPGALRYYEEQGYL
jgi:uncharacterized protein